MATKSAKLINFAVSFIDANFFKHQKEMKIAIIGGGNMGGAIARGLYASGLVKSSDLYVADKSSAVLEATKNDIPGVNTFDDNKSAVKVADYVILAVKPWLVESVVFDLAPALDPKQHTFISIAAGVALEKVNSYIGKPGFTLFRILPNTAIAMRQSMSFVCSMNATKEQEQAVLDIFSQLGKAIMIPENQMSAFTSISSCGIAYILRFIRAAAEGGCELGIRPDICHEVVAQTMIGAAQLILQNHSNPEVEIDKVTTPGGWTIKGLNAMEENGFTKSVIAGIKANG